MKVRLETFQPEHAIGLDSEQKIDERLDPDPETSFTAYLGDEILFCAGVAAYWPGRGEAWALINRKLAKDHTFGIVKTFRRYLEYCPFQRIEASADVGDVRYNNFLKALGFSMVIPVARNYLPGGGNASVYEMVRE